MTKRTPGSASERAVANAAQVDRYSPCRIRASAPRRLHAALAAGAAVAVLTGVPISAAVAQSHTAAVPPHRSGLLSASGLTTRALFAKVHRAYLHAPAVELSVIARKSTLRFPRRFVLILQSGRVVAEEFTRTGRDGTTLVAKSFHQTYARTVGAKCWRRLPASNPQTLTDVGVPFPYTRTALGIGGKALPPQRTAFGWKVATENRAEFWFLVLQPRRPAHLLAQRHLPIKRFITYAIEARSYRLRSLYIQQPAHRASEHLALGHAQGDSSDRGTTVANADSSLLVPRELLARQPLPLPRVYNALGPYAAMGSSKLVSRGIPPCPALVVHVHGYDIPANADVGEFDIARIDEEDTHVNPMGSKGVGEIGIVGTAAAIANASITPPVSGFATCRSRRQSSCAEKVPSPLSC
jgi:hypothetical protein